MGKLYCVLKGLVFLLICTCTVRSFAQTQQRIKFTAIIPSANTGMDYTPWLNDDVNSLVQNVWENNFVWVDLKLPLIQHSIITRLSFYDYEGVFTDAPDSIYALNGTKKTFLGIFTGPAYMVYDGFTLKYPTEADAIIIHKFSNNIPQKVDIYGYPDANHNPPSVLSGNADLLKLAVSGAAISPVFSTGTLTYTATVPYSTSTIKLIPTASDGNTVIKVNGAIVTSGVSTAGLPLAVGVNTISTVLTAQDGKTVKTYTLKVTRTAASTNNSLSKLSISSGTLSPAFAAATTNYLASVAYTVASVTLTPTVADATATVTVNGTTVKSGAASAALALKIGNDTINTVVKAQSGATKTYRLVVTRAAASSNNNLANLVVGGGTISPAFATATTLYKASVAYAVASVTLTPTVADATATVTVNGTTVKSGTASAALALKVGNDTINTIVKAQNGAAKTYRLIVTRAAASSTNTLSKLVLSSGTLSPAFTAANGSYTASVANTVASATLTPTLSDATATVTINGTAVKSGAASAALSLAVGSNTLTTVVKAQNGGTKTYTVKVTRAAGATTPPPVVTSPPPPPIITSPPPPDNNPLVKIPIDSTRWYMLNNVSNGLGGLTNGDTTDFVNTGYGMLMSNYDAYYPVLPGEEIDLYQLKFYSYHSASLGNYPLTVSVIDSTGKRTVIGTYQGGVYQTWLGPDPGKSGFAIDTPVKNIKYIVLNCWYVFPAEMQLYGHYKAPTATPALKRKYYPLNQYFGVNAFEWNFEDPNNPLVVSPTYFNAVKAFTGVRHYMDWDKLESTKGEYTFNPVHSGGWNYDAMYQACKDNNICLLADLKTLPNWLIATYPADQQDAENVPVPYGADFSDPNSYILQAKVAFQYVARYGSNTSVSSSLLSVDPSIRWTNDPQNVVKKGMNLVKYIECDNERDKWWKGRKAYQTSYEYAANMSAFYDGNKNTMGPGVGVKNADPNVQVVMGGLCSADPSYVQGMVDWCRIHRGYKADGTINLCWDVINYHLYNNDSTPQGNYTTGVAPEVSIAATRAEAFIQMAHKYCGDMPVWVTESGYDANQGSPQRATPIGSKTAAQVEGDWILRTSLLYARAGIARLFYYEEYDDNAANPTQYASSGLINNDHSRRPAADYMLQVNKVFGKYTYQQTLNSSPIVDKYVLDSASAYMLVMPTQSGKTQTYALNLAGADSAYVYTPLAGASDMTFAKVKIANGSLAVNVTETPTFVIPSGVAEGVLVASTVNTKKMLAALPQQTPTPQSDEAVVVYPNPTSSFTTVALNNSSTGPVSIRVTDMTTGREISSFSGTKYGQQFQQTIDISNAPTGVCIVQIILDGKKTVRKVIKTNR